MRSRASCYDPATARMDLRRFAPAAVLYAMGLFLLLLSQINSRFGDMIGMIGSLQGFSRVMALINFGYALVLVQLLFGDLYSTRRCYAIHAMPVTRGGWFGTQIILGIAASLLPNLLVAGYLTVVITEFRLSVLLWLVCSELQFVFFFGIAVLCAALAGNRWGMAILYGVIHFAAAFAIWLRTHLYARLIYGMFFTDSSTVWCPLVRMYNRYPWAMGTRILDGEPALTGVYRNYTIAGIAPTEHLWELAVYAALGCLAIWLALKLYQHRRLERTGDLLAFPRLEPVILLATTLCGGAVGSVAAYVLNEQMQYVLLFVGCVVGYYACLMFLRRTVQVFSVRSLLPVGVVCGVLLLSLVLTGLDVLGITCWQPKAEDVASVRITSMADNRNHVVLSDPDGIGQILSVQQMILEEHREREASRPLTERIFGSEEGILYYDSSDELEPSSHLTLHFVLTNGKTFDRSYQIHSSGMYIPTLRKIFSAPRIVFSGYSGSPFLSASGSYEELLDSSMMIRYFSYRKADEEGKQVTGTLYEREDMESLMEAMLLDCAAGDLAQNYVLHGRDDGSTGYLCFTFRLGEERPVTAVTAEAQGMGTLIVTVYESSGNTRQWLEEHIYTDPPYIDLMD